MRSSAPDSFRVPPTVFRYASPAPVRNKAGASGLGTRTSRT